MPAFTAVERPVACDSTATFVVVEGVDIGDTGVTDVVVAATSLGKAYTVIALAIRMGADNGLNFDRSLEAHSTDIGHCRAVKRGSETNRVEGSSTQTAEVRIAMEVQYWLSLPEMLDPDIAKSSGQHHARVKVAEFVKKLCVCAML